MRIVTGQRIADKGRKGFTLVELLIVITIIIILVGLLASGVMKALDVAARTATQSEMSGLSTAINAFKQDFNVTYIPSQILLVEDGNYGVYTGNPASPYNQLAIDSQNYLQQMFGSRFSPTAPVKGPGLTGQGWRNNGTATAYVTANNPPMILEGQHCLVFFLGGIPAPTTPGLSGSSGVCQGFSSNPTNPTNPGGTRRGPYFDFKSNRLFNDARNIGYGATGTPLNFFVYIDGFNKTSPTTLGYTYPKQPYAFFSAYKTANNYGRYFGTVGSPDCPSLPFPPSTYPPGPPPPTTPLLPYFQPSTNPTVFMNPTSYQILSAGPDGIWGVPGSAGSPGGSWQGAIGQGTPGLDDMGNFSRTMLGAPQQ